MTQLSRKSSVRCRRALSVQRLIASGLLLATASLANGQVQVENIPNAEARPKLLWLPIIKPTTRPTYTLSIVEAPAATVLASFEKQTGIHLVAADAPPMAGPPIVASLDLKDVDLATALDRLARALAVRIEQEHSAGNTIYRVWPDGFGLRNYIPDTEHAVEAQVVQIIRNVALPRPPGEIAGSVRVVIRAWPGKQQGGAQDSQLEDVNATDDQGRPFGLLKSGHGSVSYYNDELLPTEISITLIPPSPTSHSIQSFKANAVFTRVKTVRRLTAEHFARQAVACDIDGQPINIGPARIENNMIVIPIHAWEVRTAESIKQPFSLQRLARTMLLVGSRQRVPILRYNPKTEPSQIELRFFIPGPGRSATQPGGPVSQPTTAPTIDLDSLKLAWELPGESETLKLPVSASNMPLP